MNGLHALTRPRGAKRKKRVGRGLGSGHGTYATRGQKGQRARTGGRRGIRRRAMKQLVSHLPKVRGFRSLAPVTEAVTLKQLARYDAGTLVTPERLLSDRVIRTNRRVKIIGTGTLEHALTVKANGFSASARRAITEAGGSVVVLAQRFRRRPAKNHRTQPKA